METGMVGVKVQRCGRKQALPLTHWDGRHGTERDNEAGVWTGDIMQGLVCCVKRFRACVS